MKQLFFLPAAAVVAALLAAVPGSAPAPVPGGASLERASRLLVDERSSDSDRRAGLLALLEAVSEAAPSSGIAGDWPRKVDRARALLVEGGSPDEGARALLGEAYRAATGGATFRFPAVSRLEDVVGLLRMRMESAERALRGSQPARAVPLMLEAALLVVTPAER